MDWRSDSVLAEPWLFLTVARSWKASSAPRALPSATPQTPSASRPKAGNLNSAPASFGLSDTSETDRPFGTSRSFTSISPEPVPFRPITCQVSCSAASEAGKTIMRVSGAPEARRFISPFSQIVQPPQSQVQLAEPEPHCQRPVTR